MSHNYYLHRDGDTCSTCGRDRTCSEVMIGHSGGGWVFIWRGWRDPEESPLGRPLTTPTEWWMALLAETAKGAVIADSYGKRLTLQEFWTYVHNKREPHNGRPPNKHSDTNRHSPRECIHIDGDDIAFYAFS